jgi:anti-sigma factor RsiW
MRHPTEERLLLAFDGELEADAAAEIAVHIETCALCRAQFERLKQISGAIVEYHHALRNVRSPNRVTRVLVPALAIAALLLIGLWIARPNRTGLPAIQVAARPAAAPKIVPPVSKTPVERVARRQRHRPPIAAEVAQFIELPFSDGALPLADAALVRVEIPVEELLLAGLTVGGRQPGSLVAADLLMGMDGLPRGIRLVQ